MIDFLLLAALLAFALWFWNASGAKDLATQAARAACRERQLQFLDESVVRSAVWFKRNAQGQVVWWRRYNFEFTVTGETRHGASVVLLGDAVTSIQFDPYPINNPTNPVDDEF